MNVYWQEHRCAGDIQGRGDVDGTVQIRLCGRDQERRSVGQGTEAAGGSGLGEHVLGRYLLKVGKVFLDFFIQIRLFGRQIDGVLTKIQEYIFQSWGKHNVCSFPTSS